LLIQGLHRGVDRALKGPARPGEEDAVHPAVARMRPPRDQPRLLKPIEDPGDRGRVEAEPLAEIGAALPVALPQHLEEGELHGSYSVRGQTLPRHLVDLLIRLAQKKADAFLDLIHIWPPACSRWTGPPAGWPMRGYLLLITYIILVYKLHWHKLDLPI